MNSYNIQGNDELSYSYLKVLIFDLDVIWILFIQNIDLESMDLDYEMLNLKYKIVCWMFCFCSSKIEWDP